MATKKHTARRKASRNGGLTETQAGQFLQQVKDAGPLLTKQAMYGTERALQEGMASIRRMMLSLGTISGRKLIDEVTTDREMAAAVASAYKGADDCIRLHRTVLELLEAAQIRMMIALCTRDDMQEVLSADAAAQCPPPGKRRKERERADARRPRLAVDNTGRKP